MKKNKNIVLILKLKGLIFLFSLNRKKIGINNSKYKTKLILKYESKAWKGIRKEITKLEPNMRLDKTFSKLKIFFEK